MRAREVHLKEEKNDKNRMNERTNERKKDME